MSVSGQRGTQPGARHMGLLWRIRESPKDWRYGGVRAWVRWIVHGIAADEED